MKEVNTSSTVVELPDHVRDKPPSIQAQYRRYILAKQKIDATKGKARNSSDAFNKHAATPGGAHTGTSACLRETIPYHVTCNTSPTRNVYSKWLNGCDVYVHAQLCVRACATDVCRAMCNLCYIGIPIRSIYMDRSKDYLGFRTKEWQSLGMDVTLSQTADGNTQAFIADITPFGLAARTKVIHY